MQNKVFFIDNFNLPSLLFLIFKRKVSIVYLLDSIDFFPHNKNNINIYEKIYVFFNKKIIRVPVFKVNENYIWKINETSIEIMDIIESKLINNGFSKFLNKNFGSEKLLLAFKQMYLPYFYKKILFLHQLDLLHKNNIYVDDAIYTSKEFINFEKFIKDDFIKIRHYYTPLYFRIIDFLKSFFLVLFNFPIIFEIIRKGVCVFTPKLKNYDLGVHQIWGFPIKNKRKTVFLSSNNISDAMILNNNNLYAKSTIFIKHKWNFSREQETQNSLSINNLQASEGYETKNKIPISFLFKNYFIWAYFVLSIKMLKKRYYQLNFVGIYIFQKIIIYYLNHLLFCNYYRVKIFFSRDDYDARSIIRTVVQNRFKLKHASLAHSSFLSPNYIPFTLYTHFDIYYIMGNGYKKIWNDFYSNNKIIVPGGPVHDKLIIDAMSDINIKSKFFKKYNKMTTILFLISPMGEPYSPEWLYENKYEHLHELLELDESIHLILRPRNSRGIDQFLEKFPKIRELYENGRVSCELNDFTTHELMAYVDVLIAEDASSVFLESLCRPDLFSCYYMVRYGYFKPQEGFVAYNINELKNIIESYFKKDDQYYKIMKLRNKIAKNFVEQPFGKIWDRISKNLYDNLT